MIYVGEDLEFEYDLVDVSSFSQSVGEFKGKLLKSEIPTPNRRLHLILNSISVVTKIVLIRDILTIINRNSVVPYVSMEHKINPEMTLTLMNNWNIDYGYVYTVFKKNLYRLDGNVSRNEVRDRMITT